jgi:hypothetical protein
MEPDQEQRFMAEVKCFDDEYVRPWSTKLYATQRNFLERIAETMHHPSMNVKKIPFLFRFVNNARFILRIFSRIR